MMLERGQGQPREGLLGAAEGFYLREGETQSFLDFEAII